MRATSTTDLLEPLSEHGAAARVRHLREHLPFDPLNVEILGFASCQLSQLPAAASCQLQI